MTKTDWFDPRTQQPWQPGVYERQSPTGADMPLFARWNGIHWCQNAMTPELAEESHIISQWQLSPWRGVTAP